MVLVTVSSQVANRLICRSRLYSHYVFSYSFETDNFQEPTQEVCFVSFGAFTYNFLPKIYMREQFLSKMVLPFSFMFHARYSPCLLLW